MRNHGISELCCHSSKSLFQLPPFGYGSLLLLEADDTRQGTGIAADGRVCRSKALIHDPLDNSTQVQLVTCR